LTRLLAAALAGVLAAMLAAPAAAQPIPEMERQRLLRFADGLLQSGEQYRAITEYMRFASYFPDDPRTAEMPLRIGLAYLYGGRPDDALVSLAPALQSLRDDVRADARYLRGRAYYEAGAFEQALESWGTPPSGPLGELTRRGRLLSLLHLGRRGEALHLLDEVGAAGVEPSLAESLSKKLRAAPGPARRSPALAGALSIVPGVGQLYVGRRRDALVSFLLNGLFVFGSVQSFRSGSTAAGVLLASMEAGWYTGNITSTVSSAKRFNVLAQQRYLEQVAGISSLEQRSRAEEGPLLLGVQIRF
jgi:TM2 domain-containing membrane protein YozV